jgi:hypothetical protein
MASSGAQSVGILNADRRAHVFACSLKEEFPDDFNFLARLQNMRGSNPPPPPPPHNLNLEPPPLLTSSRPQPPATLKRSTRICSLATRSTS